MSMPWRSSKCLQSRFSQYQRAQQLLKLSLQEPMISPILQPLESWYNQHWQRSFVGARAMVLPDVSIASYHAVVGAQSVVTQNVPAFRISSWQSSTGPREQINNGDE